MLSKRGLGYDPGQLSPSKRLRANIEDAFLSNVISAQRARELFEDAEAAGIAGFRAAANAGKKGAAASKIHRDILRRLLRGSKWPDLYYANIRVWSAAKQQMEIQKVPMLLPHELLRLIAARSSLDKLLEQGGHGQDGLNHLHQIQNQTGLSLLGVGLWLDGTPCNWDRSKTVETIALNFPGHTGQLANIRLPLAVILKDDCLKTETMDDLLNVVAWSMQCCLDGSMPHKRHDGTPFWKSDSKRSKASQSSLGVHAIITEVRADWACLKTTFRFPGWNENRGCCFRCTVTPLEVRSCDSFATWRRPENRHSHWTLLQKMLQEGHNISPLFKAPFTTSGLFVIDWLHCCDLGVGSDFLGNIFWVCLPLLPGTTQVLRVQALYRKIRDYYSRHVCDSRLDNLTVTMIRKTAHAPPKLRSKAAETRSLIFFAQELTQELLGHSTFDCTVKQLCIEMNKCYACLTRSSFSSQELSNACKSFCLLYKSLGDATPDDDSLWRMKPKFHLWQELCQHSKSCPSTCWTYRDEDFGGSVAQLSRRRGGGRHVAVTGHLVLNKFRAKHSLPAFV